MIKYMSLDSTRKPPGWFFYFGRSEHRRLFLRDKLDLRPRHDFFEYFYGIGKTVLVIGRNGK